MRRVFQGMTTSATPLAPIRTWRLGALGMSAGLAATALVRCLLLMLMARHWTVAEVGAYILPATLATPIVQFARLRLRCLQSSDIDAVHSPAAIWSLTGAMSVLACLVVGASAWTMYSAEFAGTAILVALGLICESYSELCYGAFLQRGRPEWIGVSQIVRAATLLVVSYVAIIATQRVVVLIAAQTLVSAVALMFWDLPVFRGLSRDGATVSTAGSWLAIRRLMATAWPLALATLFAGLSQAAPRFFVEHWRGLAGLGLLAVIGTVLVPGNIVLLGITQSSVPRVARAARTDSDAGVWRELKRVYLAGIATAIIVVFVFGIFGERLLSLAYSAEYARHPHLLRVVLAACASIYLSYSLVVPFVAFQKFADLLLVNFLGLTATVLGCLRLVPELGATGAAWSMLLGSLVVNIVLAGRTPACVRKHGVARGDELLDTSSHP